MFNKKYVFAGLVIELTRRCNKACRHCLRGDAQNLTISKEIIDKLFLDTKDCLQMYVAGGEPLLEPEILEYLIDRAAHDWNVHLIEITTNGSILNPYIVKILEEFCRTPFPSATNKVREAHLTISHDDYHTEGEWQQAINFYKPLFDEANERLACTNPQLTLSTWSPINLEEVKRKREDADNATLIYAGRGKDLLDEVINARMVISVPAINNHRLKIIGEVVYCRTMISVKGDVIVAEESNSYDAYDNSTVGNIMAKSLGDIIDTHQNNCVLSCNESRWLDQKNNLDLYMRYAQSHVNDVELLQQLISLGMKWELLHEINASTLKLREMLKKRYPILPAQDLIGELPMILDESNLDILAMRIISNTHWQTKEQLASQVSERAAQTIELISKVQAIDSAITDGIHKFCEAIAYMKNNGLSLIMKLRKEEMQALMKKAEAYSTGKCQPNNDGVFACGDIGIFANENDVGKEYAAERKIGDFYRAMNDYVKAK